MGILAIAASACGGGLDSGYDEYSGPMFAPDDLVATIPREIAGAEVVLKALSPDELERLLAVGGDDAGRLVTRLRADPSSVIGATATVAQRSGVSSVIALRSKGVPGEELRWTMVELAGRRPNTLRPDEVGDTQVMAQYPGDTGLMLHDVGEVMYLIHATDAAVADAIVTALP